MNKHIHTLGACVGWFALFVGLDKIHDSLPWILIGITLLAVTGLGFISNAFNEAKAEIAAKKESDHA